MKRLAVILVTLVLTGCQPGLQNGCTGLLGCSLTDPTGEKAKQARIQQCTRFGFKPGTDAFANCQLQLAQTGSLQNTRLTCKHNAAGGMDCN